MCTSKTFHNCQIMYQIKCCCFFTKAVKLVMTLSQQYHCDKFNKENICECWHFYITYYSIFVLSYIKSMQRKTLSK